MFVDAATSPFHVWDTVVSWDKWATDMAARTNLYRYPQGGYPQLLPMFNSLIYKVTGHYGSGLPDDQYALHAFQPVLGFVLIAASIRAAQLFAVPIWSVLILVFGFQTIQQAMTSGSADLLVSIFFVLSIILYVAWKKGDWEARLSGVPLFIACLFGSLFTKATGSFAELGFLIYSLLAGRTADGTVAIRRLSAAALTITLLMPILLAVPFYLAQYDAGHWSAESLNPYETKFLMGPQLSHLQRDTNRSHGNEMLLNRLTGSAGRFLKNYDVPEQCLYVLAALLVISFGFGYFPDL